MHGRKMHGLNTHLLLQPCTLLLCQVQRNRMFLHKRPSFIALEGLGQRLVALRSNPGDRRAERDGLML